LLELVVVLIRESQGGAFASGLPDSLRASKTWGIIAPEMAGGG